MCVLGGREAQGRAQRCSPEELDRIQDEILPLPLVDFATDVLQKATQK